MSGAAFRPDFGDTIHIAPFHLLHAAIHRFKASPLMYLPESSLARTSAPNVVSPSVDSIVISSSSVDVALLRAVARRTKPEIEWPTRFEAVALAFTGIDRSHFHLRGKMGSSSFP